MIRLRRKPDIHIVDVQPCKDGKFRPVCKSCRWRGKPAGSLLAATQASAHLRETAR